MASVVLHIKDSYYFEVPRALWRSHRAGREEYPEHLVRLSTDYQDWEASRLYDHASALVEGAPAREELLAKYTAWRDHDHHHSGWPLDRYLEKADDHAWLATFQDALKDEATAARWEQSKSEAEDMQAYYAETPGWSAEKLVEYNHQLDGKILIPQPCGRLKNNYEAESGFCISKYMIIELLVAVVIGIVFVRLANRMRSGGRPRGTVWNLLEAFLVFLRDEVVRPAIGKHDADRFIPLLWTVFFFVLGMNLAGMVPWAGAPTAAFGVTFGMACVTFSVVICSGSVKFGLLGFWKNQVPSMGLHWVLAIPIVPMIFVIEVLGLFIKHAVLGVRLLANMVAGHLVLLGVLGIAVSAAEAMSPNWALAAFISVIASTLFSCLELFVAFLQAYVFTFLSALFIGAAVHRH